MHLVVKLTTASHSPGSGHWFWRPLTDTKLGQGRNEEKYLARAEGGRREKKSQVCVKRVPKSVWRGRGGD